MRALIQITVSVKLSGENGLGYEEKERKIFRI
jgi:hypothetical protein